MTPSFVEALIALIDSRSSTIRVALPGRVEAYDASKQSVDVQPLVQEGFYDGANARQIDRLPVVTDVPIVFPGAGGFRVTFPVAVGDTVLLVFASSSIDRWLALGGEVDPRDDRRHHLSDAIAIPGLRDFAHPLSSAPTDCLSIGKDGGPTIEIDGGVIAVGGRTGAEPTLKGTTYNTTLNTLLVALNTFIVAQAVYNGLVATTNPPILSGPAGTIATAATAFETAIATFEATMSAYLTSIAEVK